MSTFGFLLIISFIIFIRFFHVWIWRGLGEAISSCSIIGIYKDFCKLFNFIIHKYDLRWRIFCFMMFVGGIFKKYKFKVKFK